VLGHAGEHRLFGVGEVVQVGSVGSRGDEVEVDADDVVRIALADEIGDGRTPVATLRAVVQVPEPGHQLRPRIGDALLSPTGAVGLAAEPVARQ